MYKLLYDEYKTWYHENIRGGVFLFDRRAVVTVGAFDYEGNAHDVRQVDGCVGVFSMPRQFLVPLKDVE